MCSLNDSIQIQYFLAPHISFILLSYMDVWCLEEVSVSLFNKVLQYTEMSHSHVMVHLFLVIYATVLPLSTTDSELSILLHNGQINTLIPGAIPVLTSYF